MRMFKTRAASAALFNPSDAFDQMPNSVMLLDRNTRTIVYANTAAEVSLKISRKILVGYELRDVFGEHQNLEDMISKCCLDSVTQRVDIVLYHGPLRPDQKEFFLSYKS